MQISRRRSKRTCWADCPAGADYWDLGVLDPAFAMSPQWSIVTDGLGLGNTSADPELVSEYRRKLAAALY